MTRRERQRSRQCRQPARRHRTRRRSSPAARRHRWRRRTNRAPSPPGPPSAGPRCATATQAHGSDRAVCRHRSPTATRAVQRCLPGEAPDTAPRPLHLAVTGHRQGGDLSATRAGARLEGQLGPRFEQPKCALPVADTAEEHHLHGFIPCGLGDPAARSNRIGDHRDPRGWRNHPQPGRTRRQAPRRRSPGTE